VVTLQTIFASIPVSLEIVHLKVDAQGWDLSILAAAKRSGVLARAKTIQAEVYCGPYRAYVGPDNSWEAHRTLLQSAGFSLHHATCGDPDANYENDAFWVQDGFTMLPYSEAKLDITKVKPKGDKGGR